MDILESINYYGNWARIIESDKSGFRETFVYLPNPERMTERLYSRNLRDI